MSTETARDSTLSNHFIRGLLNETVGVLSKWYSVRVAPSMAVVEEDDLNTSTRSQSSFRLHQRAENFRSSLAAGTASVILKKCCQEGNNGGTKLTDLPIGVLLQIVSYLDAKSLCRFGQTCHQLYNVAGDHLLWRRKLKTDVQHWKVLGHLSHPKVYHDASSDLTEQEIYANCYVNRTSLPAQSFSHPVTHTLRSLVRKLQGHTPRLLMFGSGLDSVPLVRMMLWEPQSPYKPTGLFPGKDGVGSGVRICHKNSPINLVTLYTATKAERQAASSGYSGRVNKLVSPYSAGEEDGAELTAAVQEQCQQANGFILAVNAARLEQEAVKQDIAILTAMLMSASEQSALLVLVCHVEEEDTTILSPLEVADKLDLCSLSHPWQVRQVVLNTFSGLADGIDWLLGASTK